MTNRYIVNPLTHCTELLDDNYRKETIYKLYLILFISKNCTSQHGGVHYHLRKNCNFIVLKTIYVVF